MVEQVCVEILYALPEQQVLHPLRLPAGTSLLAALKRPEVAGLYPGLSLLELPVGIFGRRIARPGEYTLQEGDRIELYRPLLVDPMDIRRQRAAARNRLVR